MTLMVQFAPIASDDPQLLVCAKSPGLNPAMLIPVMARAAVPMFDRVTARAVLGVPTDIEPNATDVGESWTKGASAAELKFTLAALALLTVTFRLVGVNANPALLGVTVYDPLVRPVNM
jgi:hypothetical protein